MNKKCLINEKVAAFYANISDDERLENVEEYFRVNHTLKFKRIQTLLHESNANLNDFSNLKYEDYLLFYKKLRPIFQQTQRMLENVAIKELQLNWLGDTKFVLEIFNTVNLNANGTEQVEQVLLLSSMLEFALGSIFCTLSALKTPPHLLKDLLSTEELSNCFGAEAITFLKIILGTPKSINLRNIVWHGFPKPKFIPKYYVATLLITIHTLGDMLLEKALKIQHRNLITDFSTPLTTILKELNLTFNFSLAELNTQLENCCLLPADYKAYWFQLFIYMKNLKYWRFVILILPQIELVLRLIYSNSNDFDVSAKLDEYYITLDTIFEPTVPERETGLGHFNNLFNEQSVISEGALQLIYDLFLTPKGLRLRDKISHGEFDIGTINNKELCYMLLYLSLNLLTQNEIQYPINKYESQFHLNSLTKFALNGAIENFMNFIQVLKIDFTTKNFKLIEYRCKIFRRPKKETIYMLLIFKIAKLQTETCNKLEESIKLRQCLLVQYKLHSRRRRTLENLMKSLPCTCACLNTILQCLLEIFEDLQSTNDTGNLDDSCNLQRFLKHTLKIVQSFTKYTHKDSNEWIKTMELCNDFNKYYEQLFMKWKEGRVLK